MDFLGLFTQASRGGGFQKGGRQRTKPHRPQTGCLRFSLSVFHPLSLSFQWNENMEGDPYGSKDTWDTVCNSCLFPPKMFTKPNLSCHNYLVLLFLLFLFPVLHSIQSDNTLFSMYTLDQFVYSQGIDP